MDRKITYFENKGKRNTEATLGLARSRAEELGVRQVVVATTHGYTALKAAEIFADCQSRPAVIVLSPLVVSPR